MKRKKWFHIAVGFIAGFSYVACGSGEGTSGGSTQLATATAGTNTTLSNSTLTGTWKGNVYTSNIAQHTDFTLTLNSDGTFTCSGFTQATDQSGVEQATDYASWINTCNKPITWEVTKTAIRLSYNTGTETRARNLIVLLQHNSSLAVSDSGGSYSDTITELTKVE